MACDFHARPAQTPPVPLCHGRLRPSFSPLGAQNSRLHQIIEWLKVDPNAVIIFDEAHCVRFDGPPSPLPLAAPSQPITASLTRSSARVSVGDRGEVYPLSSMQLALQQSQSKLQTPTRAPAQGKNLVGSNRSNTAYLVVGLQKRFPQARILYATATGAQAPLAGGGLRAAAETAAVVSLLSAVHQSAAWETSSPAGG